MSCSNFAELKDKIYEWSADDEDIVNRIFLINLVASQVKRVYW